MVIKLREQAAPPPMVYEEPRGNPAAHAQTMEGAEHARGKGQCISELRVHSMSLTIFSKTDGVDSPRMRVTIFPLRSTKKVVGKALTP